MKACEGILEVEERNVSFTEALDADEVFITATNQRIMPIIQIDNTVINKGEIGTVTKKLQELFLKEE